MVHSVYVTKSNIRYPASKQTACMLSTTVIFMLICNLMQFSKFAEIVLHTHTFSVSFSFCHLHWTILRTSDNSKISYNKVESSDVLVLYYSFSFYLFGFYPIILVLIIKISLVLARILDEVNGECL